MVAIGFWVRPSLVLDLFSWTDERTGGRLINNDTIVKIGLDLVDGCWNTYASTAYVLATLSLETQILT